MGRPLYNWSGSTGTRTATAGSVFCTSWLTPGANGEAYSLFNVQVQVATAASFNAVLEDTNGLLGLASAASLTQQFHVDYEATSLTAGVAYNFDYKVHASTKVNFSFGGAVSVNQLFVEEIPTPSY